jgi:CRP-like cAMP-binding protein
MTTPEQLHRRNAILASLPAEEYRLVAPLLNDRLLLNGEVIQPAEARALHVYFPYHAMVSLVTELEDGTIVEAATTGREGAVNALAAIGDTIGSARAVVQIEGMGGQIAATSLRAIAARTPRLQQGIRQYLSVFVQQVMQTAACNAVHPVRQRLARWLLTTHDHIEGDAFYLTHEFLSHMLGTHRPSVTVAAGELQSAGIIRYRRGHIEVIDRLRLEDAACECHRTIRERLTAFPVTNA